MEGEGFVRRDHKTIVSAKGRSRELNIHVLALQPMIRTAGSRPWKAKSAGFGRLLRARPGRPHGLVERFLEPQLDLRPEPALDQDAAGR